MCFRELLKFIVHFAQPFSSSKRCCSCYHKLHAAALYHIHWTALNIWVAQGLMPLCTVCGLTDANLVCGDHQAVQMCSVCTYSCKGEIETARMARLGVWRWYTQNWTLGEKERRVWLDGNVLHCCTWNAGMFRHLYSLVHLTAGLNYMYGPAHSTCGAASYTNLAWSLAS